MSSPHWIGAWLLLLGACVGAPPPPPGQGGGSSSTDAGSSTGTPPDPDTSTGSVDSGTTTDRADSTSEGGESSSSGGLEAKGVCTHQCSDDTDCGINGMDVGLVCSGARCTFGAACSSDGQCVVDLSGWADGQSCKISDQCEAVQHCVGVDGSGHCLPSANGMGGCPEGMQPVPVMNTIGDMVEVCGYPNAACGDDGACFLSCSSDDECTDPLYPVCNDRSECGCGDDTPCQDMGQPGASTCVDGVCGCVSDQECEDAGLGDLCVAGQCACSDDRACIGGPPFDGGTFSCLR